MWSRLIELLECPVCHESLEFKGTMSHNRLSKGLLSCKNKHLYPVKDEVPILKDPKMSENEFSWIIDFPDLKRYEKIQSEYTSLLDPDQVEADKSLLEAIAKAASNEHLILDVASGMGRLLLALSSTLRGRGDVIGIDVDEKPLNGAKLKLKSEETYDSVSLCVMDGKHLALKKGKVPYVVSYFGFNNIPETPLAFKEAARVMKRDGRLLMSVLYLKEGSGSLKKAEEMGYDSIASEKRLAEVLEKTGFTVERSEVFYEGKWLRNPMDALPMEGDWFAHALVSARKASGTLVS